MAEVKIVNVTLRVKPGKAEEFKTGVALIIPVLEKLDGTLAFVISQSDDDPLEFQFFEVYRDEEAFETHLRMATTELSERAHMDALVDGPFRTTFGQRVAGGVRLGATAT